MNIFGKKKIRRVDAKSIRTSFCNVMPLQASSSLSSGKSKTSRPMVRYPVAANFPSGDLSPLTHDACMKNTGGKKKCVSGGLKKSGKHIDQSLNAMLLL